jgi:hypothetical protein
MASVKFYLDKRSKKKDGTYPLKISITHKRKYILLSTGISIDSEQWNEQLGKIIQHPNKLFMNNYIEHQKMDIETELLQMRSNGEIETISEKDLRKKFQDKISGNVEVNANPLFFDCFKTFADNKSNPRTRENYLYTLSKIKDFSDNAEQLQFEDITYIWLKDFDEYLSKGSGINSRSIHLRNIRAVFNEALKYDITTLYPFRKFRIKNEETAKRSLTVEELIRIRDFPCKEYQKKYIDIFMLTFYLIGINTIDLCNLKEITHGRIEYKRAKTNKLYSIKIEAEAAEIIKRYNGKEYLLNIMDRYTNYKDYAHRLNNNLQKIMPSLTTYWARHTWATIAHKIGIPKDTISLSLGHEFGCKTTDIYIDYDMDKVDEANRKVIDYINSFNKNMS